MLCDDDELGNPSLEVIQFGDRTINYGSLMSIADCGRKGVLCLSDLPHLGLFSVGCLSCTALVGIKLNSTFRLLLLMNRHSPTCDLLFQGGIILCYWSYSIQKYFQLVVFINRLHRSGG